MARAVRGHHEGSALAMTLGNVRHQISGLGRQLRNSQPYKLGDTGQWSETYPGSQGACARLQLVTDFSSYGELHTLHIYIWSS